MSKRLKSRLTVNILLSLIYLGTAALSPEDIFGLQFKYPPAVVVLLLANVVYGARKIVFSTLMLLSAFVFHHFTVVHSNSTLVNSSYWFEVFYFGVFVGIIVDFLHLAIARSQDKRILEEKKWNHAQGATIRDLEKVIQTLKWRIGVETLPVSQIFQFAKNIIGAESTFIAKAALDLLDKRFSFQSCGFYKSTGSTLHLEATSGNFSLRWPVHLDLSSTSGFPEILQCIRRKEVVSPRDFPNGMTSPSIIVPALGDSGDLRGILVAEGVEFMQMTPFAIDYLREVGGVCGIALEKSENLEQLSSPSSGASFRYLSPDNFENLCSQISHLILKDAFSVDTLALNLENLRYNRQTQIIQKLLRIQLEQQTQLTGFFSFTKSTLLFALQKTDHNSTVILANEVESLLKRLPDDVRARVE